MYLALVSFLEDFCSLEFFIFFGTVYFFQDQIFVGDCMPRPFVFALGNKELIFCDFFWCLAFGSNTPLCNSGRASHYSTGDPGTRPGPDTSAGHFSA